MSKTKVEVKGASGLISSAWSKVADHPRRSADSTSSRSYHPLITGASLPSDRSHPKTAISWVPMNALKARTFLVAACLFLALSGSGMAGDSNTRETPYVQDTQEEYVSISWSLEDSEPTDRAKQLALTYCEERRSSPRLLAVLPQKPYEAGRFLTWYKCG